MNQPLEQGEQLAAIIKSIRAQGYENRTTLLICDYLNRHNCTAAQALEQGESFLQEHQFLLNKLHIVRWQDFLASRNQEIFAQRVSEVREKNIAGSHFNLKMKKTWEKCLSSTQSLNAQEFGQTPVISSFKAFNVLFDYLFGILRRPLFPSKREYMIKI